VIVATVEVRRMMAGDPQKGQTMEQTLDALARAVESLK